MVVIVVVLVWTRALLRPVVSRLLVGDPAGGAITAVAGVVVGVVLMIGVSSSGVAVRCPDRSSTPRARPVSRPARGRSGDPAHRVCRGGRRRRDTGRRRRSVVPVAGGCGSAVSACKHVFAVNGR